FNGPVREIPCFETNIPGQTVSKRWYREKANFQPELNSVDGAPSHREHLSELNLGAAITLQLGKESSIGQWARKRCVSQRSSCGSMVGATQSLGPGHRPAGKRDPH